MNALGEVLPEVPAPALFPRVSVLVMALQTVPYTPTAPPPPAVPYWL